MATDVHKLVEDISLTTRFSGKCVLPDCLHGKGGARLGSHCPGSALAGPLIRSTEV